MTKIVGTITSKLVCNLRLKTPLSSGPRMWLAARLIRAAAFLLGGKMIVDLEPELIMCTGKSEKMPTIGTFTGHAYSGVS